MTRKTQLSVHSLVFAVILVELDTLPSFVYLRGYVTLMVPKDVIRERNGNGRLSTRIHTRTHDTWCASRGIHITSALDYDHRHGSNTTQLFHAVKI